METADGLLVLAADEGERFPSLDIVRKSTASQGDGRWGVVVVTGEPDEDGGRTHIHRGAAEAFFLLEGRVELLGAESVTPLEPGAFVLVPPDTEHGLRVLKPQRARWLAIWPRDLDGLPEELEAAAREGRGPAAVAAIRDAHGVSPGRSR